MAGDLLLDNITDTDGVFLTAHTPDTRIGVTAWGKAANPRDDSIKIVSNRGVHQFVNGSNSTLHVIQSGAANCTGTLNFISAAAPPAQLQVGLGLRFTDTNNGWVCYINQGDGGDEIRLTEITTGTQTVRATAALTLSTNTAYSLVVTVSGTTITATIGATSVSYSSSQHQTSIGVALRAYLAAGVTDANNSKFDKVQVVP